ncbi:uncharacterized protein ZBAI_02082 [Zygosaccharomyces bailii ISA1307]|nr:uncharacterized protein ZBAI_02082 [Zygosaccharomyces bailii ISA1307]
MSDNNIYAQNFHEDMMRLNEVMMERGDDIVLRDKVAALASGYYKLNDDNKLELVDPSSDPPNLNPRPGGIPGNVEKGSLRARYGHLVDDGGLPDGLLSYMYSYAQIRERGA